MCLCIYSKRDGNEAEFRNKEHIVPKCIGGMLCLPIGTVSDEINNEFSKIELDFARNDPRIAIPRMFNKPIGRKKHENREKVCVMQDDTGSAGLGVIINGEPFFLDQIIFNNLLEDEMNLENNYQLRLNYDGNIKDPEIRIKEFISKLSLCYDKFNIIEECSIESGKCLLGIQGKKLFLGIDNRNNYIKFKNKISSLIQKFISLEPLQNVIKSSEKKECLVEGIYKYCINIAACKRVYAKIAFNCLTYLKGKKFVMDKRFDDIRTAILSGTDIDKYVYIVSGPNIVDEVISRHIKIGQQSHSIYLCVKDKYLCGLVFLFGKENPIGIKLAKCIPDESISKVYVCDWENEIEGFIGEDFFMKYLEK